MVFIIFSLIKLETIIIEYTHLDFTEKTISGSPHQRTKPDVASETVTSDVTNETVTCEFNFQH